MASELYLRNKEKIKAYAEAHEEELKEYLRDYYLKTRWGITREEFLEMLDEQEGKCLICEVKLEERGYKNNSACIDHDHETGMVRGILCRTCNRGIGLLKDNAENLRKAADYIERIGY